MRSSWEAGLDTDVPAIEFSTLSGLINADMTVGVDITVTKALLANEGLCSPGVKLHGAGSIVTRVQAEALGLGRPPGLEKHIRTYRNGRDLMSRPRSVMVIDLFGLEFEEVRDRFPEVYQHLALDCETRARQQQPGILSHKLVDIWRTTQGASPSTRGAETNTLQPLKPPNIASSNSSMLPFCPTTN